MPQITLECSDNIIEKVRDFPPLFKYIHQVLSEKLPTELDSCKSRVINYKDYAVGNQDPNNAFVYLSIGVLKGRSKDTLDTIAHLLMEKLTLFFAESIKTRHLQISLAIQDLPDVYHKYKSTNI